MHTLKTRILTFCLCSLTLMACTTDRPVLVGSLAGAAGGAGVGAIVAHGSSSISNARGIGFGALIGIPVGIAAAYASDTAAKYYIVSQNNNAISGNYQAIYDNQALLDQLRYEALIERPRGNPDPDLAEYLYEGQTLGNPWR